MRTVLIAVTLVLGSLTAAWAHCQVPCGIYDDEMRLKMIGENIKTIERAMKSINDLSDDEQANYNQIVRWIMVKEEHADDIADIVSWYFLQQRVKPVGPDEGDTYHQYVRKLTILHGLLVSSMKAKQTTDLATIQELDALLDDFTNAYMGEK